MKNLSNKILVFVFIGFLSLSLLLTAVVNFGDITSSLYENKSGLLNYKTAFSTISSAFGENLIFIDNYADIYGGIQRTQGKTIWSDAAGNTYILANDGKIYSFDPDMAYETDETGLTIKEKETIDLCADALIDFSVEMKNRDIELVFVQAPAKYDSEYVTLPVSKRSSDKSKLNYLAGLISYNEDIHQINLQNYFCEQNIPFDDWFFATDHHWTIKAAFSAYQKICDTINSDTDIEIDKSFYDSENWNSEIIEKAFLGSLAEKIGSQFIEKDDLELIYPKFETDYKVISSSYDNPHETVENGAISYSEGLFTESVLKKKGSSFSYGSYLGGDVCEVRITNSKSATDKKLLIIKDSFAKPVGAFLSTCFSETRLLDPRYFHEGVLDYIDAYKPDVVLVLYNPSAYNPDNFFNFE